MNEILIVSDQNGGHKQGEHKSDILVSLNKNRFMFIQCTTMKMSESIDFLIYFQELTLNQMENVFLDLLDF